MRNTNLELTQIDQTDNYDVPNNEEHHFDESIQNTQEPIMLDISDLSSFKLNAENSVFNGAVSFDSNFNFWKLMEPDSWQMSTLIRDSKNSKKNY